MYHLQTRSTYSQNYNNTRTTHTYHSNVQKTISSGCNGLLLELEMLPKQRGISKEYYFKF